MRTARSNRRVEKKRFEGRIETAIEVIITREEAKASLYPGGLDPTSRYVMRCQACGAVVCFFDSIPRTYGRLTVLKCAKCGGAQPLSRDGHTYDPSLIHEVDQEITDWLSKRSGGTRPTTDKET
jgi:hypothetical protein